MPDVNQLQTGYATNFGAGQGSNTNRAIENFIVESTFRVLVTRFALMHKELKMLDNSVSTYYVNCYFCYDYIGSIACILTQCPSARRG